MGLEFIHLSLTPSLLCVSPVISKAFHDILLYFSPCLLLCQSQQWSQSDPSKHKSHTNGALPAFLTLFSISLTFINFILVSGLGLWHFLSPLCGMSFTLTVPGLCFCHWTLNLIFLEPCLDLALPHPIWSNQPPLSAIWILLFSFFLSHFSLRWSWHSFLFLHDPEYLEQCFAYIWT